MRCRSRSIVWSTAVVGSLLSLGKDSRLYYLLCNPYFKSRLLRVASLVQLCLLKINLKEITIGLLIVVKIGLIEEMGTSCCNKKVPQTFFHIPCICENLI